MATFAKNRSPLSSYNNSSRFGKKRSVNAGSASELWFHRVASRHKLNSLQLPYPDHWRIIRLSRNHNRCRVDTLDQEVGVCKAVGRGPFRICYSPRPLQVGWSLLLYFLEIRSAEYNLKDLRRSIHGQVCSGATQLCKVTRRSVLFSRLQFPSFNAQPFP